MRLVSEPPIRLTLLAERYRLCRSRRRHGRAAALLDGAHECLRERPSPCDLRSVLVLRPRIALGDFVSERSFRAFEWTPAPLALDVGICGGERSLMEPSLASIVAAHS
jgi:hypothetical protein